MVRGRLKVTVMVFVLISSAVGVGKACVCSMEARPMNLGVVGR